MSKIEWTDETWNPTTGCKKVSQGCKNCYAERLWPRIASAEQIRNADGPGIFPPLREFTDVRLHPERLDKPLHWKKPRRIFVDSMSDLFQEDVPFDFIDQVFAVMAMCPQHTFQILTKRPARMREYLTRPLSLNEVELAAERRRPSVGTPFSPKYVFPWPLPNVWLGVSVEDQETADERITLLMQTPAAVRFISAEPLLSPVDLRAVPLPPCDDVEKLWPGFDWVITGGESGPKARPSHPDWFRSLRDQCDAAGVAFFFKQWGEWQPFALTPWRGHGTDQPTLPDGEQVTIRHRKTHHFDDVHMVKIGKKNAGRILDGRTHEEYPA